MPTLNRRENGQPSWRKTTELAVKSSKKNCCRHRPDALIPLCDQLAACKREIDHAFSKLETARIAVLQTEMPEDQRPKFEAALKHVAEVYASALASAERHYLKEQVVFAQTLGSFLDMDEVLTWPNYRLNSKYWPSNA